MDYICKYKLLVNCENKSFFCDIKQNDKYEITNS